MLLSAASGTIIDFNDEQFQNDQLLIVVTEAGMDMEERAEHPKKIQMGIIVIELGRIIDLRAKH